MTDEIEPEGVDIDSPDPGEPEGPLRPWEKTEAETELQYRAFLSYRDQDKTVRGRSLRKVERDGFATMKTVVSWGQKHQWQARVAAWDAHLERAKDEARIHAAALSAAKWEARRQEMSEESHSLAKALQAKARRLLKMPLFKKTVHRVNNSRDKIPVEITYEPAKWTLGTASTMARVAHDLAKASRLDATEDELDGFDPETATPEECARVIAAVSARRKAARNAIVDAGRES